MPKIHLIKVSLMITSRGEFHLITESEQWNKFHAHNIPESEFVTLYKIIIEQSSLENLWYFMFAVKVRLRDPLWFDVR